MKTLYTSNTAHTALEDCSYKRWLRFDREAPCPRCSQGRLEAFARIQGYGCALCGQTGKAAGWQSALLAEELMQGQHAHSCLSEALRLTQSQPWVGDLSEDLRNWNNDTWNPAEEVLCALFENERRVTLAEWAERGNPLGLSLDRILWRGEIQAWGWVMFCLPVLLMDWRVEDVEVQRDFVVYEGDCPAEGRWTSDGCPLHDRGCPVCGDDIEGIRLLKPTRQDAVLVHRRTGARAVLEFKTSNANEDGRAAEALSGQSLMHQAEVEARTGACAGVLYHFLLKGGKHEGDLTGPLFSCWERDGEASLKHSKGASRACPFERGWEPLAWLRRALELEEDLPESRTRICQLYDCRDLMQHPAQAVERCAEGFRGRELRYLRDRAAGEPPRSLGSSCFNRWGRKCMFHDHCYQGVPFEDLAAEGRIVGRWPHHKEGE